MPLYHYRALNEHGEATKGLVEAESPAAAAETLAARGFIPEKLQERRPGPSPDALRRFTEGLRPLPAPDLILFTKQFSTLFKAGVPMISLLDILARQTENKRLRQIVEAIRHDIREGSSLHEAFRRHPGAFSPLYCSMIQAGELSGSLPSVMNRLKYIIEHEHKVKSDIRSAMVYPLFVIVLLVVAFLILLTVVTPKFVRIFARSGIDLPVPTQVSMVLYQFLNQHWSAALLILAALTAWTAWYLHTPQGRFLKDYLLLRLPLVGPLVVKSAMSRFASIFSILQASGVVVLDSISILSQTIGNTAISREFDRVRVLLEEGRGIAKPLQSANYFTPMVINMVAVGEESGNLEEMLKEVSEHYDAEVEYAIKKLTDAIGPLLIICLAVLVGFFALAIFLPMWDLTKMTRM
jgi:type II secretory pathway component PulF